MWVCCHFTHHPRPSSLLMPSKHARKKPVKARGLKEAAAKQATPKLSARKGKHAAQGKENHPSGMAAPVSTASSVLMSAPISVSMDGKGMSIHYCLSLLTMLIGHGATVSNVPESPRDTSTLMTLPHEDVLDAEVRILRGKYIYIFVCILLIFSYLLFFFFYSSDCADERRAQSCSRGSSWWLYHRRCSGGMPKANQESCCGVVALLPLLFFFFL